jgi:hypothetical protein
MRASWLTVASAAPGPPATLPAAAAAAASVKSITRSVVASTRNATRLAAGSAPRASCREGREQVWGRMTGVASQLSSGKH